MKIITLRTITLGLILVIGAIMRFWGNSKGLPDIYVNDEIYEVNRALQLLRGEYDFHRAGKGFYYFILTIAYYFYGNVQVFLGTVANLEEYISHSIVYPAQAIRIGRMVSASFGVATILLVYQLGKNVLPQRKWAPEIFLAFAWAVCSPIVFISNWSLVENTLVLLSVLAFFPILNIYRRGCTKDYIFAAVLIAMATASKLYGLTLISAVIVAHVISVNRVEVGGFAKKIIDIKIIYFFLMFIFMWAVTDMAMVAQILGIAGIVQSNYVKIESVVPIDKTTHMMFYIANVRWSIGNIFTVFLLIGSAVAFINKKTDILILLFFSYGYIVLISVYPSETYNMHYMLMALPGLFIGGVYGMIVVFDYLYKCQVGKNLKVLLPLMVSVGVTFIVYDWIGGIYRNPYFWNDFIPVEVEAKIWVENNIPAGSKITMPNNGGVWPGQQTFPLYNTAENYLSRYEAAVSKNEIFKNMSALPDLARVQVNKRYDLVLVSGSENWLGVADYLDMDVNYFVIDKQRFTKGKASHMPHAAAHRQSRVEFYENLKQSDMVENLIAFDSVNMFGEKKTIEIYSRVPNSPLF